MPTSAEILNACAWAEHHLLSRYAETEDGKYGFFREFWSPAPLAIKTDAGRIHASGWSHLAKWIEGYAPPVGGGVLPAWYPYTACLNGLRVQAKGRYFGYAELKGFEDRDFCDGELTDPRQIDYNRIQFMIQHETTQLIRNSSGLFVDENGKPFFWNYDPAGNGWWYTDSFTLKPRTYYWFEVGYLGKTDREERFKFRCFDGAGKQISEQQVSLPAGTDTGTEWKILEAIFYAPANAVTGKIFAERTPETLTVTNFVLLEYDETLGIVPPTTVTVTIQLVYRKPGTHAFEVYLGGCLGVGRLTPKKLSNKVRDVPYEETLPPFTGYGTVRYCARHSSLELYHQLLSDMTSKSESELRKMASKVKALLDDYCFTWDRYEPFYRASDSYPDDYFVDKETAHEATLWNLARSCGGGSCCNAATLPPSGAPFGLNYYQYWSVVDINREYYLGESFLRSGMYGIFYPSADKAFAAVHLMNKYNDPAREVQIWTPSGNIWMSADGLLLYGCRADLSPIMPLITDYTSRKGFLSYGTDFYDTTVLASALIAFAELGYGFGYEKAKTLADEMADILIKTQWGYPYTTQSTPQNPTGNEGLFQNEELGLINRPDLAGATVQGYKVEGGKVISVFRLKPYLEGVEITSGYYMPFETGVYDPAEWGKPENRLELGSAWLENTILFQRALHVYHWYKYQGGTGAFPANVLPKGVRWQPAISDMAQVTVT